MKRATPAAIATALAILVNGVASAQTSENNTINTNVNRNTQVNQKTSNNIGGTATVGKRFTLGMVAKKFVTFSGYNSLSRNLHAGGNNLSLSDCKQQAEINARSEFKGMVTEAVCESASQKTTAIFNDPERPKASAWTPLKNSR